MDKPYEVIDKNLAKILDNDVNLVIVFQYIKHIEDKGSEITKPLTDGVFHYAPTIMHRFTQAMPYYNKYKIQECISTLIDKGFVIKSSFLASETAQSKTSGYRINRALLRWENQFLSLRTLIPNNGSDIIDKEIKDITYKFMYNIREAFSKV